MGIMEALNFMVNNGFLNIDTSGSIYVFANLFANTAYVFLPSHLALSANTSRSRVAQWAAETRFSFLPTANLVYQDDIQLKQALEHWLCQASERGAVFAGNDIYALRVLDALRKLDVSIPEEVGVIGFDDTSTGRYLNPRLSSVSQVCPP